MSKFICLAFILCMFSTEADARRYGRHRNRDWRVYIALAGVVGLSMYVFKKKVTDRNLKIREHLKRLSKIDPQWDEFNLTEHASKAFIQVQKSWFEQNLSQLQQIIHPRVFPKWEEALKKSKDLHLNALKVNKCVMVDYENYEGQENDCFTVFIDAYIGKEFQTKGWFVKTKATGSHIYEFWTFEYERGQWLLREIHQPQKWQKFVHKKIIDHKKAKSRIAA